MRRNKQQHVIANKVTALCLLTATGQAGKQKHKSRQTLTRAVY
jgi:hypothetical protein